MPLGKRVQALPGNELLRDLPLELNAVGTLSGQVPSRVVLEFGDAISGISRVSGQAARSIG